MPFWYFSIFSRDVHAQFAHFIVSVAFEIIWYRECEFGSFLQANATSDLQKVFWKMSDDALETKLSRFTNSIWAHLAQKLASLEVLRPLRQSLNTNVQVML